MIPSALSHQLHQGLADFLRFSFWSSTPGMENVVEHLLADDGMLLRGPYVSLKTPFQSGESPDYFPHIPLGFIPHRHQEQVFARLGGRRKECTLLATGTGSGKTESFLLPILDHCLADTHQPGVKAILIYPMNALANDQAGRLARLIHHNPKLRGRITAGLYIGQGDTRGPATRGETQMGPATLITDHKALQERPPDILLTNYKMLDYLLLRASDQKIWQHNTKGTLRFLVVDEIHTFDGAQGTDLACLLRRLKRRLEVDDGSLCCIGTSATLGGPAAAHDLRHYAKKVFGETFDSHSIIGESHMSEAEFLGEREIRSTTEPGPGDRALLDPARASDPKSWLEDQERLWLGDSHAEPENRADEKASDETAEDETTEDEAFEDTRAVALGEKLAHHATFQALLLALRGESVALDQLVAKLARSRSAWRDDPELGRLALISLLALVSKARAWRHELPEARERRRAQGLPRPTRPFLDVRLQLWQRELRRLVASVGRDPHLRHSADLDQEALDRHLPMVHCRECGALGWAALVPRDKPHLFRTELQSFYRAYFGKDNRVRFLFPLAAWPEGDPQRHAAFTLDCQTLTKVGPHDSPEGETLEVVPATSLHSSAGKQVLSRDCPFCAARESLTLIGFQAATLTSVYIDQIFASPFNEDKKLLTFSDSVQDAAHRAGFFGARTWRTNLRIAILRAIEAHGEPTLAELVDRLGPWWRERLDLATWVSTFLAPNMTWLHDWGELQEDGELPTGSNLPELIDRRLAFETVSEFGLQARIGRSLTRTGSACAYLDPEKLEAALAQIPEPLRNEVPGLREVEEADVAAFVVGLLHHLRCRGGIAARCLPSPYLESRGRDLHVFKRDIALPAFGATSRLPALLTDRPGSRFETWGRPGHGGESWYRRWADRCFTAGRALGGDVGSIYDVALPILVGAGLLERLESKKRQPIWGVREGAIRITSRTAALVCRSCGHRLQVATREAESFLGIPCLTARCEGTYGTDSEPDRDYFGRLYAHGDLQRIFTHEHTGLLDREERERVEREFKALEGGPGDPDARRPWFTNLLSCTPTLEMGIDVGDLSSAILCSVPPGQANYLQRIGRAGRRDGNAFLLTVAGARPHDLYFFAEPREMLAGEVPPPGVFLDAPAVLERQLTAFAIDRWVAEHGAEAEVPPRLGSVLARLDDASPRRFPANLLAFVDRHREALLREFSEMFEEEITAETAEHLRHFLEGDDEGGQTLESKLLDALQRERKERDSLSAKAKSLRGQLKELRQTEARDEDHEKQLEALEAQNEALLALVRGINQRRTLEFLTDAGLLPNYAFPESAVRLRSVIWRKKKATPAEGSAYETWSYEYSRSPSSALSELAPGADFYASGRRVRIDTVDLSSSEVETWRFCSECSHAQNVDVGDEARACPACGHAGWRDTGQKMRLLKLQQVFANTPDRESRIRDERDERQPRFFERQILVIVDPRSASRAWRLEDPKLPFGFEYLARATFRDVNFGEPSEQGVKNTIAGREAVRQGFELCVRCGKVQKPEKPRRHDLSCPTRKAGVREEIEPCVYLYREFSSEALRLLLPLTELGTTRQLHSFIAALQLGLESYFAGSVDHLRTTVYSDPVSGGPLRRQYLVLFDTVPGGTGFLRQLMIPEAQSGEMPLFAALERALERIETCECWPDPERNGCYRCLYAYRNSRDMNDTSASEASELLRQILAGREELQPIERLGEISVTGLLDSKLEAHFLEALRQVTDRDGRSAKLKRIPMGSKSGWLWTLGEAQWRIEPQVEPPPSETGGIAVSIDFVMRPAKAESPRRLAIFLDGWEFHRGRIGRDLQQRMALIASGRWDVWSFTWPDLDQKLSAAPRGRGEVPELAIADRASFKEMMRKLGLAAFDGLVDEPVFDWLVRELVSEDGLPWPKLAKAALASRMRPAVPRDDKAWSAFVDQAAPAAAKDRLASWVPRLITAASQEEHRFFELMAVHDGSTAAVLCRLDDRPEHLEAPEMRELWRGYLRLFQWLRQADETWFLTAGALAENLDFTPIVRSRTRAEAPPTAWSALDEIETPYRPLAEALAAMGAPEPTVGLEIPDSRGDTWSEAEMVWENRRIAITSRADTVRALGDPDSGWTIFYLEELPERADGRGPDVSKLLEILQIEES